MGRMKCFIKNRIFAAVVTALLPWCATMYARTSMGQAFVDLPRNVIPLLDSVMRADLIDYAEAGRVRPEVKNIAGGKSTLDTLTSDYLKIKISEASTFEMKALPNANLKAPAYLAIYTIGSPSTAGDAELMLFSSQMQPLPLKKYFQLPATAQFFNFSKDGEVNKKNISSYVPFPTVVYNIDSGSGECQFTATLTVGEYMPREDYAEIKPYLANPLRYKWNGKKFSLVK